MNSTVAMENCSNFSCKFKAYTANNIDTIQALERLPASVREEMAIVAKVLPFRVNNYVIDELIDWDNIPADPIFQLTFPQREMLPPEDYELIASLVKSNADNEKLNQAVHEIRERLNPHPAGQMELNVPKLDGEAVEGMQHKYAETVLFFPSQGQVCHSFCTFCFRWAQFVGDKHLRFGSNEASDLHTYLREHQNVTDLLMTGGDPMVMTARLLEQYIEPLLQPDMAHVQNIRIGTKSLAFWPYRYLSDPDSDELLRLFERIVKSGRHLAFMAHFNHWREMETPAVREAIRRILDTGAVIRTQSPLIAHINDDTEVWVRMWKEQVRLGMVPYYMFVERDTGAKHYFEVPLVDAWKIYRNALRKVSGLIRTVRGPSMSAAPGKVEISGVATINGEKVFVLRFIQGRKSDWVQRPFFAHFDEKATWLDQLKPAFGEEKFFYEDEYNEMLVKSSQ